MKFLIMEIAFEMPLIIWFQTPSLYVRRLLPPLLINIYVYIKQQVKS